MFTNGLSPLVLSWIQRCQADALVWYDGDYVDRCAALGRAMTQVPATRAQLDRIGVSSALIRVVWHAQRDLRAMLEIDRSPAHMPRRRRVGACLADIFAMSHDRGLTLDALAAGMDVTASYLSRAIRAETTFTFTSLVHVARMAEAIVLLRASELRIEEIATRAGYAATCEFDRRFRRWFHMTPTTFRSATMARVQPVADARDAVTRAVGAAPGASPADVADRLGVDFGLVLAVCFPS